MKFDLSSLSMPESEEAVEAFDWSAFPPAALNRKSNFFLIVDESTGIKGKLVTWTTFIHGQVEGLILAEHVQVEETGHVNGLIFCRTLEVLGTVNANVICDSVHVRGKGVLSGTVKHKSVRVEDSGRVAGSFERRKPVLGARQLQSV
jgi:cytoskeletal protein CcmA (bactofilin family)